MDRWRQMSSLRFAAIQALRFIDMRPCEVPQPDVSMDDKQMRTLETQLRRFGGITVGVLCGYEVFALTTDRIPTISALCRVARNNPFAAATIWAALGVLSWHLLLDD